MVSNIIGNESELDNYLIYNPTTDRVESTKSIEVIPSSFYLGGGMSLSNGIDAIDVNLSNGQEGFALVQNISRNSGTFRSPQNYIFADEVERVEVFGDGEEIVTGTFNSIIQATADRAYTAMIVKPNTEGRIRIVGDLRLPYRPPSRVLNIYKDFEMSDLDEDGYLTIDLPNILVAHEGMYLEFFISGVELKGLSDTQGYLAVKALPFVEEGLWIGHQHLDSDKELQTGGEYTIYVNSEDGIDIKIPAGFRDAFTIRDFQGTLATNKQCRIDFTSFLQETVTLQSPYDEFLFFYANSDWYYMKLNNNENNVAKGGRV